MANKEENSPSPDIQVCESEHQSSSLSPNCSCLQVVEAVWKSSSKIQISFMHIVIRLRQWL